MKKALRQKYKSLRSQLPSEAHDEKSLEIANKTLECDLWGYNYYHIFLPIKRLHEVNTEYLLSILSGKDKNILLSRSNFETHTMQHFLLTDSTKIILNPYDIPEPEEGIELPAAMIDVVFIPLLAYDCKGNRIGYGKGFYDRFLAACKPEVLKVGLSFFEPEKEAIASGPHDIQLDYCITPEHIYKFYKSRVDKTKKCKEIQKKLKEPILDGTLKKSLRSSFRFNPS